MTSTPHAQAIVPAKRGFRKELHGVRGLAISMIVLFHIFAHGRVSGGIDVFLAITGFLAIPSLVRRAEKGWGGWLLDIGKRFTDLFRRLAIPLIPVLGAIGVLGIYVLPISSQSQVFTEIIASALFFENWELINSQLTYDAAGPGTSPLQHIWSTSIQGQFHVVMTFMVIFVLLLAKIVRISSRWALTVVLAAITIASFVFAIQETAVNQEVAYFSTFTRAWELTGPAILGLWASKISLSGRLSGFISWMGIYLIVSCPFVFDGASEFPGPEALWPVTGVCLILAAGSSGTFWGGDRVLQLAPFQFLGNISYSLYLWHWPILIFALNITERTQTTPALGGIVVCLSIVFGYLGKKLFEDGVASWSLLKKTWISVPLAASLVFAIVSYGPQVISWSDIRQENARIEMRLIASDSSHPGAVALIENLDVPEAAVLPKRGDAIQDSPWHYTQNKYRRCIQRNDLRSVLVCDDGTPLGDRKLVVITGGSHAGQWSEVFKVLGERYGWKVVVVEKSGCLLSTEPQGVPGGGPITKDCAAWNEQAIPQIIDMDPDLVVALGTTRRVGTVEGASDGMLDAFHTINGAGIPMMLMRENPTRETAFVSCWEATQGVPNCKEPRSLFYDPVIDREGLDVDPEMSVLFDTSKYLCTEDTCSTVIGNVLVFRDTDHITTTMTLTITSYIEDALRELSPDLFDNPTASP